MPDWGAAVAFATLSAAVAAVAALAVSKRARSAAFRLGYRAYADTRLGLALHRALSMSAPQPAGTPLKGHSSVSFTSFGGFGVLPIAVLGDNYSYLLVDEKTRHAALVDPADAGVCLRAVELAGVRLTHVLTTHKHWDHAGGNGDVKAAHPSVEVVGGRGDGVDAATLEVGDGDTLQVGETVVKVVETPGHTRGHVVYVAHPAPAGGGGDAPGSLPAAALASLDADAWQATGAAFHSAARAVDPLAERSVAAFTGDLLFSAGCGRFFEGVGQDFYEALVRRLGVMADSTLFFCGHEYTESNLAFARWVEPDSEALAAKTAWAAARRETKSATVPFSLAEERLVNPFMRVHALAASIEGRSGRKLDASLPAAVATMSLLRELKNDGVHNKPAASKDE